MIKILVLATGLLAGDLTQEGYEVNPVCSYEAISLLVDKQLALGDVATREYSISYPTDECTVREEEITGDNPHSIHFERRNIVSKGSHPLETD